MDRVLEFSLIVYTRPILGSIGSVLKARNFFVSYPLRIGPDVTLYKILNIQLSNSSPTSANFRQLQTATAHSFFKP